MIQGSFYGVILGINLDKNGFTGMSEGPGMSGHGGNKQKTDGPKHFIIFPSVEAAMMYKVNYIERYNGNWAR